jgi:hypothetical protein
VADFCTRSEELSLIDEELAMVKRQLQGRGKAHNAMLINKVKELESSRAFEMTKIR